MEFRALQDNLHELAHATINYFGGQYGIAKAKFKIEEELAPSIPYRPTMYAQKRDHSLVGIEVSEAPRPPNIEALILGCKNNFVPLKLWIVVPAGIEGVAPADIHFLRENGAGLLELGLDGTNRQLVGPPIPLSLAGVRSIRYADFPSRYREDLRGAYETFVGGSPAKGCSLIYDEIEGLSRRVCERCARKCLLRSSPNFNVGTVAWATLLTFLRANVDRSCPGCAELTDDLFARLQGLPGYRNQTGHKPRNLKQLIDRDRRLRTRFESAIDEFQALVEASRGLRP